MVFRGFVEPSCLLLQPDNRHFQKGKPIAAHADHTLEPMLKVLIYDSSTMNSNLYSIIKKGYTL